jgi:hypothetical protein
LNPTKTDRRFFQSRLRELIENRVVERVTLPSTARSGQGVVPGIRLLPDDAGVTNVNESPATITREPTAYDVPGTDGQSSTLKLNTTLHKQMVDLLETAGTKGMTLNVCKLVPFVCLSITRYSNRKSQEHWGISTAVLLNFS